MGQCNDDTLRALATVMETARKAQKNGKVLAASSYDERGLYTTIILCPQDIIIDTEPIT